MTTADETIEFWAQRLAHDLPHVSGIDYLERRLHLARCFIAAACRDFALQSLHEWGIPNAEVAALLAKLFAPPDFGRLAATQEPRGLAAPGAVRVPEDRP